MTLIDVMSLILLRDGGGVHTEGEGAMGIDKSIHRDQFASKDPSLRRLL